MMRVAHLFDASTGWEQRSGARALTEGVAATYRPVLAASLDRRGPTMTQDRSVPVQWIGFGAGLAPLQPLLVAPAVRRWATTHRIDVFHTWGIAAAAAACIAAHSMKHQDLHVVIELFDPVIPRRTGKFLRVLAASCNLALICSSQRVRRAAVEAGVPPDRCAVIRPGVDYARINRARQGTLRKQLGIGGGETAVILPEPNEHRHNDLDAVVACACLDLVEDRVRLIVPGGSREARRLAGFAQSLPNPSVLVQPPQDIPFEDLLAVSDMLIVPARGDVSTTAIAWAMAGGLVIIGSAVYAVAELIATKLNGLLYKPEPGRRMVTDIARLMCARQVHPKIREVARGQAFEVFSLRRYRDQHLRLYANLVEGKPAGDGITDPAMLG